MQKDEITKAPARQTRPPSPDDGPDDMELTVQRKPRVAINTASGLFGETAKERSGGINTRNSVFEKGTVFHTE
ncbi:MAG: hypothetical protein LBK57_09315 [Clostridiales Family XIII bacterium]|nr:hypothetical protein [Clostridiales Family XIII bacterium]